MAIADLNQDDVTIEAVLPEDPTDFGPMSAWWVADDITDLSGALVNTWPDRSGNGRDLTHVADANRPTKVSEALGRHAAVVFDGTSSYLQTAAAVTLDEILDNSAFGVVFIVAKPVMTVAAQRHVILGSPSGFHFGVCAPDHA